MEPEATTSSHSLILLFILAFAFGILVSSFYSVTPLIAAFIFIIGLGILAAEKVQNNNVAREALVIALCLISFSLGSLRYSVKDFHELQIPTEKGVVVNEPEDKDNVRRFVFLSDNKEKVLVSVPLYTEVEYGDLITAAGKLERPGIIKGENVPSTRLGASKRDFDYGKYLSKDDIYYTLSFAKIEVLSHGHGNPIKTALFEIKKNFVAHAKSILSEPYASLLLGLIVAGRDALPADILEEFRKAGVIHIVVLSGFNITIIAEFLRRAFQSLFLLFGFIRFPQAAAGASILGVLLFVVMTGGEATVVRAAIMALTVIVAKLFGRRYSASRALLVAAFLMLMENPKILAFDPSFQLSFLATLGLIYVHPLVEKLLNRGILINRVQLRETLSQTISTQTTVLPLLVYSMGDVSLVSLPANILILLVVPWTMLFGFIAICASYAGALFAWPIAYVSHLMLSWILFVSHTFGSLSFATLSVTGIPFWIIAFIYLVLGIAIFYLRKPKLSFEA